MTLRRTQHAPPALEDDKLRSGGPCTTAQYILPHEGQWGWKEPTPCVPKFQMALPCHLVSHSYGAVVG